MTRKPEKANVNSPGAPEEAETREDPGFFRRWSERKRRARGGQEEEPLPAATSSAPRAEAAGAADETSERELTDEDMPPLESLNEDSDYSGFLSPGVSEHLRRAALRKLFSSAKLNVVDGLDDYAEDYRSFEALGDIITADMRFDMEREAERAKKALDEKTREDTEDTTPGAEAHERETATTAGEEPAEAEGGAGDTRIASIDSETPDSDDGDARDGESSRTG